MADWELYHPRHSRAWVERTLRISDRDERNKKDAKRIERKRRKILEGNQRRCGKTLEKMLRVSDLGRERGRGPVMMSKPPWRR